MIKIKRTKEYKKRMWYALYECDCGEIFEALENNVNRGNTTSCGCHRSLKAKDKWENIYKNRAFPKVKDQKSPEYLAYRNMKSRCYNEKDISFNRYGRIGIKVCDRWLNSFDDFYEDMGSRPSKNHSLDRIDTTGDYSPENCRWVLSSIQARNKTKQAGCSSKYKGVSFENGKWRARIKNKSGNPVSLGSFVEEIEAALKVDEFLTSEFGTDCSWTNKRLGLIEKEMYNE